MTHRYGDRQSQLPRIGTRTELGTHEACDGLLFRPLGHDLSHLVIVVLLFAPLALTREPVDEVEKLLPIVGRNLAHAVAPGTDQPWLVREIDRAVAIAVRTIMDQFDSKFHSMSSTS